MSQDKAAENEMVRWLSHSNELGKVPSQIEIANNFNYINMKYYIFKFKKHTYDSKWLIGICGGYEIDSLKNCGHIFSDYKEYDKKTEKEDAIKMIEMIREYWKNIAKDFENNF